MKKYGRYLISAIVTLTLTGIAHGRSFADMSAEEVSALLTQKQPRHTTAFAKDAAVITDVATLLPVMLTAEDMVGKVYGVVDPSVSRTECVRRTRDVLRLTPQEDNGALWLESAAGYAVNYYGMIPDVSAMVRFHSQSGDASVADYGFFFLFPYSGATKHDTVSRQADFCGALLQEMADMGLPLDLNTNTPDLFEAIGEYNGSLVNVRLLDDAAGAGTGRYVLILSVEPGAFSPEDHLAALAENGE